MKLSVVIKPNSRENRLRVEGNTIRVKIKAPAQEGKANEELICYLSELFQIPKSSVDILTGRNSPHKRLELHADEAYIRAVLARHEEAKR